MKKLLVLMILALTVPCFAEPVEYKNSDGIGTSFVSLLLGLPVLITNPASISATVSFAGRPTGVATDPISASFAPGTSMSISGTMTTLATQSLCQQPMSLTFPLATNTLVTLAQVLASEGYTYTTPCSVLPSCEAGNIWISFATSTTPADLIASHGHKLTAGMSDFSAKVGISNYNIWMCADPAETVFPTASVRLVPQK